MKEKTTFKMPRFIVLNIQKFIITKRRRQAFEKWGGGGGGEGGGRGTESLKKCTPPWLNAEENFEICKL